jgi:hypothetical protein
MARLCPVLRCYPGCTKQLVSTVTQVISSAYCVTKNRTFILPPYNGEKV